MRFQEESQLEIDFNLSTTVCSYKDADCPDEQNGYSALRGEDLTGNSLLEELLDAR